MRIAVDGMGGDNAPAATAAGALVSCEEPGHEVVLVGDPRALAEALAPLGGAGDRVSIEPASGVVGMGEAPSAAVKRRDTSMAVAVDLLRRGEVQAVVSAGNSGAFMACSLLSLDRLPGIERPAIAIFVPTADGTRVLLDAGANADCRPAHLVQFARMGRVYMEAALGVANPTVGLLSIGEEPTKGGEFTKAAHRLLSGVADEIGFVGNVEGDRIFAGGPHVIVCDGFAGNVFLKTAEGTAALLLQALREAFQSSVQGRLCAAMMRGALAKLRETFDYATYGGALLLGVNGICVVGHGRSDARAIKSAICAAKRAIAGEVVSHIADSCSHPTVAPAAS